MIQTGMISVRHRIYPRRKCGCPTIENEGGGAEKYQGKSACFTERLQFTIKGSGSFSDGFHGRLFAKHIPFQARKFHSLTFFKRP